MKQSKPMIDLWLEQAFVNQFVVQRQLNRVADKGETNVIPVVGLQRESLGSATSDRVCHSVAIADTEDFFVPAGACDPMLVDAFRFQEQRKSTDGWMSRHLAGTVIEVIAECFPIPQRTMVISPTARLRTIRVRTSNEQSILGLPTELGRLVALRVSVAVVLVLRLHGHQAASRLRLAKERCVPAIHAIAVHKQYFAWDYGVAGEAGIAKCCRARVVRVERDPRAGAIDFFFVDHVVVQQVLHAAIRNFNRNRAE